MIPFALQPEPPAFDDQVRSPGHDWLQSNSGGRPKALWTICKPALADAFNNLCAYSVMYEAVGTVHHFVSIDEDRSLAYEWSNYRYASQWLNASKGKLSSPLVLDPFDVCHGWFEILLPSLQLVCTNAIPAEFEERAQRMLDRLHLGHDERVLRQRREWLRMFEEGEMTLDGLRSKAPLIAEAIERRESET